MIIICCVLLLAFELHGVAGAESDLDVVKRVLKEPRRDGSKWPWQEHADDLKPLGDRALPLLASLLENYDFGYQAAATMIVIDENKAAPMIFASMPKTEENARYYSFRHFLRRLHKDAKLPFRTEMHDAGVRCLNTRKYSQETEQALLVVGLSGNKADFPLLESYYSSFEPPTNRWQKQLRNAAEAALARLGHDKYLTGIETQLSAPVRNPISEPAAYDLHDSIMKAGFSRNTRFIPLLCRHLSDPWPPVSSDVFPPRPAVSAGLALDQIVNNAPPDIRYTEIDWQKWCEKNQHKYRR